MINLTGAENNWLNQIAMPQDGVDNETAVSLQGGIQQLADNVASLRAQTSPSVRTCAFRPTFANFSGLNTGFAITSLTGVMIPVSGEIDFIGAGTEFLSIVSTIHTAGHAYMFDLTPDMVFDGNTLTQIALDFLPAGSHVGLPEVPAAIFVARYLRGATSATSLLSTTGGWAKDTSADVTSYQTAHDLIYTPNQNNVIDHSQYTYTLVFANESGTNALSNGQARSLQFTSTRP